MTVAEQTLDEFLETVASATVTPSGGAVGAVSGAAGAALCEMVCIHTIDKDGYEDVTTELTAIRDDLADSRDRLLELADEDVEAVDAVQAAYEQTGGDRSQKLNKALERATEVPLETAEECLDVLEDATVVTEKGTNTAIADAGTGAFLVHGTLRAAVVTVRSNLTTIDDDTYVTEAANRADELETVGDSAIEQVQCTLAQFQQEG